jgi:putative hydrolase of HD superfamily
MSIPPAPDRLASQLQFLIELDKLKHVLRRSYLADGSRRENSAEHSWHVALLALVLAEHAPRPLGTMRVVAMMLVHDIVEIDAGDTFVYDLAGQAQKAEREQAAATRLFGLLPPDQAARLRALWDEFEAGVTSEAKFAAGIDRLMPLLHNYLAEGRTWREHGVTRDQVLAANRHMAAGAPALWAFAERLIDDAAAKGYLQS